MANRERLIVVLVVLVGGLMLGGCRVQSQPTITNGKAAGWSYPQADRFRTSEYPGHCRKPSVLREGLNLTWSVPGTELLTADLDIDGDLELIVANAARVSALDHAGQELWSQQLPKKAGSLLIEDVDPEPGLEIVGACNDGRGNSTVFVLSLNGEILKSIRFEVNQEGISVAAVDDLDNDGKLEIVTRVGSGYGRHRRGLWVFDYDSGGIKWKFQIGPQPGSLIVDDVDGDRKKEILLGMGSPHNGNRANGYSDLEAAWVICFDCTGSVIWDAKLGTWGLSPKYADLDGDGKRELIIYRNQDYYGGNASVYVLDPRTGRVRHRFDGQANDSCWEGAAGDLDGDGNMEVLATFGVKERCLRMLDARMRELKVLKAVEVAKAIGDIDGKRHLEVVTADYRGSTLYVRDHTLALVTSLQLPGEGVGAVRISDLDGDGDNELIVQSGGKFHVYSPLD